MQIADGIHYIGVNDHDIDLFEGQFVVPDGMAYNSYAIVDQKIAVMDSVDQHFGQEWIQNLEAALDGREPDYLIVQHMEPDHSANVSLFMERYPQATVVASVSAFNMMANYFGTKYEGRNMVIKEGSTLSLGTHELSFVAAPLVHWPEVMFTYDATAKVLFSADAFGKFGALDVEQDWDCEARRYYFGIVGKFGKNVQAVLKKVAALDIQTICPLHGPVLSGDLTHYLSQYDTWSSYGVETPGVVIAYTSVYGHTRQTVEELAAALSKKGAQRVVVTDLARDDQAEALEDAFRHSVLVLATTTYNGGFFPTMHEFVSHLVDHNFQRRTVAFVQNGSWMPAAAKGMRALLEQCAGIDFAQNVVTVKGSLDDESRAQIDALADELVAKI
ncbi:MULTISPECIES: FprA family A-type flavoprotein [Atopobiaceae]|uniref:Flavorubredoxin n=1 Tax=Parafannyhessea umbonata TaxID=604330 RepID=A0A1H6IBV3_9ACTN|nr:MULTISPECIES: flavodoxin domain-containing protein [Atopobiaceae]SEH43883.1 Flavorubredoxin [Parafannyhessea umbonata]SJZ58809.1 Flavorubredoxin [Olsenella sp. KH1P3]